MVVLDELTKIKAPNVNGEASIVQGIAKEVSASILKQFEAKLSTFLTKSEYDKHRQEYDKFTAANEFKSTQSNKEIQDINQALRRAADDILALERKVMAQDKCLNEQVVSKVFLENQLSGYITKEEFNQLELKMGDYPTTAQFEEYKVFAEEKANDAEEYMF
jgi:hypothetical protein